MKRIVTVIILVLFLFIPLSTVKAMSASDAIAAKAKELAWPLGTSKSKYNYKGGSPTKEYKAAMDKYLHYSKAKIRKYKYATGASCTVYVTTVIRATGYDSKFPVSIPKNHKHCNNSSKWKKVSLSNVVAGDVLIRHDNHHIMIYGGKSGGKHIWYEAHLVAQGGTYGYAHYGQKPTKKTKFDAYHATGNVDGSNIGTIDGAKAIIEACDELAWPLGTSKKKWKKPTTALKKYVDATWPNRKWGRKYGASCDKAVFIAVRKSGYDPKFKKNLEDQINPDNWDRTKWQLVQGGKSASLDRSKFKTGDIIVTDRPGTGAHIFIVYRAKGNGKKQIVAEGSYSNAYHLHLVESKGEVHQKPGNLGNWHWRPIGKINGNEPDDTEDILQEIKVGTAYTKCNQLLSDKVVDILKYIFLIIQIATPLLLIILTMVDFAKVIVSSDKSALNAALSRFIKRALIAACIFMVPTLINFAMDITGVSDGVCGIS